MAVNVSLENYQEEFDPSDFLKHYCCRTGEIPCRVQHALRCYHEAFLTIPNGVTVLDYGAGPVMISAATKASEIVLCDYTENNRKALCQWLKGDLDAFDWSPHFSYVVRDLEGRGEQEVKERQEHVRKLVEAVVHCDINKDPLIDPDYNKGYDVVISSLVMEGASRNRTEFQTNISKLSSLIKPGGTILYYGIDNQLGYYSIGDRYFPNVIVTSEFAVSAFKRAGFTDLTLDKYTSIHNPNHVFRFI